MNTIEKLAPCPFCGSTGAQFERIGTPRQSCIVACNNCGARHESSDEGLACGSSWNDRAQQAGGVPAGWRFERVSDGDIRAYGPCGETWLIRAADNGTFEGFAHRLVSMLAAAPSPSAVQPLSEAPNYKGLLDKILTETTMGGILHAIEQARGIVWARGIVTPKEPTP